MAGHPLAGKERGVHVLGLMKAISPNIHSDIEELWDTVIPKLIQYLGRQHLNMNKFYT